MSLALRDRTHQIYDAFSAGRFDELADMFDENVDFVSNAPVEVFPYLGHRVGRAAVLDALAAVHREFDEVKFIPIRMTVEGQTAALIVSIGLRQRASGRHIRLSAAHFLQFRNNRVVEYRAFLDTFDAVQQVLGRELA
jgi:ketosteroid isomerase-like protein